MSAIDITPKPDLIKRIKNDETRTEKNKRFQKIRTAIGRKKKKKKHDK